MDRTINGWLTRWMNGYMVQVVIWSTSYDMWVE